MCGAFVLRHFISHVIKDISDTSHSIRQKSLDDGLYKAFAVRRHLLSSVVHEGIRTPISPTTAVDVASTPRRHLKEIISFLIYKLDSTVTCLSLYLQRISHSHFLLLSLPPAHHAGCPPPLRQGTSGTSQQAGIACSCL